MRRPVLIAVAIAALVLPAAAEAGCMATAGLAPPPDTLKPGQTWNARVTVLQHGVRPLNGLQPTVTIVNESTGARREFAARPAGKAGTYVAPVVFPAAGNWSYEVWDGFVVMGGEPVPCDQTHTFAAVTIGGPATTGGPTASPPAPPAEVAPAAASDDGGPGVGVFLAVVLGGIAVAAATGLALAHRLSRRHARHAGA